MLAVIFVPIFVRRRTAERTDTMARRKKYPKLPNGYGSIKRLSGKNRTNPYGVYPPTEEFDENGNPVPVKALCYVDDWYKGFTVLTWYKHGEYYPGREKELTESGNAELNNMIATILGKYTQTQREIVDQKTFEDVFKDFYQWKFKKEYTNQREKRSSSESSYRVAYRNCEELHSKSFRSLTADDLQVVLDNCSTVKGLKHSSLELVKNLYTQMYKYADANDLCDKKYSDYVQIRIPDDDEHGIPFSDDDLRILWNHMEHPTIEMLLIMCYSGFRISEYIGLEVNIKEKYFLGGLKTDAGKNRIVPIYSGIMPLVKKRITREGSLLPCTTQTFREQMTSVLSELGLEQHTPHDCRHTFSKLCDDYKIDWKCKKLMLGHSFGDVTNKVYLHRTLEDLRMEIEKIKLCR